jgi:acyl-CoA synthetase (AMP-forming)/AMP-acid ligase II
VLTPGAILQTIERQASSRPAAIALEERPGARITYGQLARDIDAVASGLERHGLRAGASVLFTVPPSVASITLILALLRIGVTIVAADPRMGAAVFAARMRLAEPTWVVATSLVYVLGGVAPARAALRLGGLELPDLGRQAPQRVRVGRWLPGTPRSLSFEDLRTGVLGEAPDGQPDPTLVLFTSGTTASPKGVVHTARSMGASVEAILDHLDPTPDDVVYSAELFLNVPALMRGARSVIPRYRSFDPGRWIRDVEQTRATIANGVPSEMVGVAGAASSQSVRLPRRLHRLLFGSAPARRPFLERVELAVDPSTEVWSIYAMTEMLPVAAIEMREKLSYTGPGDLIGRPFPGVRVRAAADGELIVDGPSLFDRYLGGAQVREHATGDIGTVDDIGRVVLFGRKKEMFIRGHDNIYPSLVEDVVDAIPGVRRSCLCGYYDEGLADERVVLLVEPDQHEDPARIASRVGAAIRSGPWRIDAAAMPDRIVATALPLDARSRKVDRGAALAKVLRVPS